MNAKSDLRSAASAMPVDTGFLDGLRALSALWVVVAHCLIWGGYHGLIPNPKIAVDIFMVISGYVITLTFKPGEGAFAFYARRAFRLLPVYYLALLAAFSCFAAYGDGYAHLQTLAPWRWVGSPHKPAEYVADVRSLLIHASMLFGLIPSYSIGSMLPDWSLTLEWQFYLAFPLMLPSLRRHPVVWAAASFSLAWLFWPVSPYPEPSALPLKLPVFLVGVFGCLYYQTAVRSMFWAALGLLLAHGVFSARYLYGWQALAFVPLGLVVFDTGALANWMRNLLGGRWFKFMARASYASYLLHGFFISLVGGPALLALAPSHPRVGLAALICIVLVGTYATSGAVYHLLERPCTDFGKRWSKRFAQRRGGSHPSAQVANADAAE